MHAAVVAVATVVAFGLNQRVYLCHVRYSPPVPQLLARMLYRKCVKDEHDKEMDTTYTWMHDK